MEIMKEVVYACRDFPTQVTFRGLSRMYEAIQLPDESTSIKTLTADSQDFVVGEMIRVRLVQQ